MWGCMGWIRVGFHAVHLPTKDSTVVSGYLCPMRSTGLSQSRQQLCITDPIWNSEQSYLFISPLGLECFSIWPTHRSTPPQHKKWSILWSVMFSTRTLALPQEHGLIQVKLLFADFLVNVVAHLPSRNGSSTSMCVPTPPQTSISTKSCHDLPLISHTALHPCLEAMAWWCHKCCAQKRRQGTTRLQPWDSVRKSAKNKCPSCTSSRIKDCTDASVILGEMGNSFMGKLLGWICWFFNMSSSVHLWFITPPYANRCKALQSLKFCCTKFCGLSRPQKTRRKWDITCHN